MTRSSGRTANDWFAVLGGHRAGGNGCALIYKSKDLVHWQFLNVLMEGAEKNWECPNFFKLGDKWVLIYSPHGPVRYYTGTLTKDYKFVPEYHGTLDESTDFLRPDIGARPGRPAHPLGLGPGQGRRLERLPDAAASADAASRRPTRHGAGEGDGETAMHRERKQGEYGPRDLALPSNRPTAWNCWLG